MKARKEDLLYPELSYQIVGVLFDVYNELGHGYKERYYQQAIAKDLTNKGINFEREARFPLEYKNDKLGDLFLDFVIEDKVVLEVKRGNFFSRKNIEQIYEYLKVSNMQLGILANFTDSGIRFKRVVNIK